MNAKLLDKQIAATCRKNKVSLRHARHVADLSETLYEKTRHVNGLTKTARPLVRCSAMLHQVASKLQGDDEPVVGKLGKLLEDVDQLSDAQKRICAAAAKLGPTTADITAMVRSLSANPDDTEMQIAARIAAVIRISIGLDDSQTQDTDIEAVQDTGEEIRIVAKGTSGVVRDAQTAHSHGNLWNDLLIRPVQVIHSNTPCSSYLPVIQPAQPISESVRRVLQRLVEKLWSLEYGLDFDEDPEYVHEMRVATRRIRTALSMISDSLGPQGGYWSGEFGWLAKALGDVRDMDVMIEMVGAYRPEAPRTHGPALDDLITSLNRSRGIYRSKLIKAIGSPRYEKLSSGFGRAVQNPIGSLQGLQAVGPRAGEPTSTEARRILIGQIDELAGIGRDISDKTPDQLHQIRLQCKALRYSIEFFSDLYGSRLDDLRSGAEQLQDLLGEVHDFDVWVERVEAHEKRNEDDKAALRASKALKKYLSSLRQERLQKAFGKWKSFTRPKALAELRDQACDPRP
ncbi:MAG: CHAD domain-containing protein [Planctomycetota bacterium]